MLNFLLSNLGDYPAENELVPVSKINAEPHRNQPPQARCWLNESSTTRQPKTSPWPISGSSKRGSPNRVQISNINRQASSGARARHRLVEEIDFKACSTSRGRKSYISFERAKKWAITQARQSRRKTVIIWRGRVERALKFNRHDRLSKSSQFRRDSRIRDLEMGTWSKIKLNSNYWISFDLHFKLLFVLISTNLNTVVTQNQ